MKMKELPSMERPYEKLENYGASSLSMAELLAIIIKTGTKKKTALEIAQDLLKDDTKEKGICFLNDYSLQELMAKEGIGRVKAISLKAVTELANRSVKPSKTKDIMISSPQDVYELLVSSYQGESREIIKTILLTIHHKVIKVVDNAIGSGNTSAVEVKDIFKEPIKVGARSIIIVHNHPSGDATPSALDIDFTKKVNKVGKIMGITVLDHIIIAEREFASLRELKKF